MHASLVFAFVSEGLSDTTTRELLVSPPSAPMWVASSRAKYNAFCTSGKGLIKATHVSLSWNHSGHKSCSFLSSSLQLTRLSRHQSTLHTITCSLSHAQTIFGGPIGFHLPGGTVNQYARILPYNFPAAPFTVEGFVNVAIGNAGKFM